jgi:ABC-type branched-subunit amino acid transport system substrate-binding protein
MRAATAARKLLTIDKVDALLTWSSGTGITAASIAESKKIPHLSIASDPAVALEKNYSFTYWPLASDEAQHLYAHLSASGIKRVAIISQVHNGILAIRDAFLQQAAQDGKLVVAADEEVAGDATDFRAVLERIKAKGEFDAFIPIFFPGQLSVCITQARALGIAAPLFGFETFEDKDEIKAAGGRMSGAVYVTGGEPQADFIKRYQAKYPGESHYTANQAYDIIQLFAASTRVHKDSATILDFLRSRRNHTTSSGPVSVTVNNQFRLPTTLKRIGTDGIPRGL